MVLGLLTYEQFGKGISMNPTNNNRYQVNLNLPYPALQPQKRCPEYASAMLSNIGSSNSEMSAVSLYFYNSVILQPEYSSFARCFHDISIVEMHHLDVFASLALQLGADPRLWSMRNRGTYYWTPAYNQYPRELQEMLENSIKGEMAAIQKYTKQAETIHDNNIVEILRRIILDEQHHIKIFNDMLSQISS